jgi:TM2 domain-containing membrane protein YozV
LEKKKRKKSVINQTEKEKKSFVGTNNKCKLILFHFFLHFYDSCNMHNFISICIIFLTLSIILSYSRFIPARDKVHLGGISDPRRWERWCSSDFECGRGFCQGYSCQCYRGYITWRYGDICNYQQNKKLTAFLLSFFLGIFGVDWFYLSRGTAGYIIAGIIKLLITLGCIIGWPIVIVNRSKNKANLIVIGNIINVLLSVASFIWWLTDWIRILANVFYDGYGEPLQPWGYYYYNDRMPYSG